MDPRPRPSPISNLLFDISLEKRIHFYQVGRDELDKCKKKKKSHSYNSVKIPNAEFSPSSLHLNTFPTALPVQ